MRCLSWCLAGLLVTVCVAASEEPYSSNNNNNNNYNNNNKGPENADEDSQIYVYPTGFKGGRYYYGGIYRGACHNDGLYYRDDSSFVTCSNGNAYVQPCAPGTRSSGQHRYSPGYYYGYSDFCDINLVDQGYGPAHYAPYGVPTFNEAAPSYGTKDSPQYDTKQPTSYSDSAATYRDSTAYGSYGQYRSNEGYGSYHGATKDPYDKKKDLYGAGGDPYGKDTYGKDTYGKDTYGKDTYGKGQAYSPYESRDIYDKKETAYESSAKY